MQIAYSLFITISLIVLWNSSCLLCVVAGRDFTLGVSSVTVSAGSPATVSLNFLEDRVALEGIESATLQLNYPEGSLPSGAIIKRNVRLSITDTDGEISSVVLSRRC